MKIKRRLRRKYKRLGAAVAGAAILSSAMLPGISAATVHASPIYQPNVPVTTSTPASETTVNVDPIKVTATKTAANRSPAETVSANASAYGFSSDAQYRVLQQSGSKAIVQVRSNGRTSKVDLVLKDGKWVVKAVRGIGDRNNPATYTTAGYFSKLATPIANYITGSITNVTVPAAATLGMAQQILFQTTKYNDWAWNNATYPQDMTFGVLLNNPISEGIGTPLATNLLNSLNSIDFGRQFVLYAHLGSTGSYGYGIGISQIAQTGNDITVTVRTKSPMSFLTLSPTKRDDVIAIDRGTLNFNAPINITFVNQTGIVLDKYVINP